MRNPSLALVAAIACLAAVPAHAAWQPGGAALSPVPGVAESYDMRGLLADGVGGAYAIWQYSVPLPDLSGTTFTLAAQRVDFLGNRPAPWLPAGSVIRSWISSGGSGTYSIETLPLLDDHAGGAILPLIDHTFTVEFVHYFRLYHVAPAGAVSAIPGFGDPASGFPVLAAAADADGAGGVVFVAVRQTFAPPLGTPPPTPLFVQRTDGSGNLLWPAGAEAPGPELVPPGQSGFDLAALADGAGGAYFAWLDSREVGDPDVYVQHVDAAGAIASGWPAGGVQVCGAAGGQFEPHLATDGAGGVIVVWRDERDGTSRLYANAVLASGALAPGIPVDGRQLPTSSLDDRLVNVVDDGQGGAFVVRAALTPAFVGISHLHRLDDTMQPRPGWPAEGIALNTLSASDGRVGLLADGAGGAFVSFRNGFGSTPPEGLYAQHFAADGTPAPGWTTAPYLLSGTGLESRIVRSFAGAITGWTDDRARGDMVFAQRLESDGPVATELALVGAALDGGAVSLRWFAAGAVGARFTIERRTEATPWGALADARVDGTGTLAFVDRSVVPGARYGYRVTWLEGSTPRTGGETWIAVPGLALALESPRPNPATGPVSVALTLPDARGARLVVFDLAGRRVAQRDLAGLGVGTHVVPLGEAASLAPGVYTLRLEQGGAVRLARMCVLAR